MVSLDQQAVIQPTLQLKTLNDLNNYCWQAPVVNLPLHEPRIIPGWAWGRLAILHDFDAPNCNLQVEIDNIRLQLGNMQHAATCKKWVIPCPDSELLRTNV
eukprot:4583917-Amphidinium_carterae.1